MKYVLAMAHEIIDYTTAQTTNYINFTDYTTGVDQMSINIIQHPVYR